MPAPKYAAQLTTGTKLHGLEWKTTIKNEGFFMSLGRVQQIRFSNYIVSAYVRVECLDIDEAVRS